MTVLYLVIFLGLAVPVFGASGAEFKVEGQPILTPLPRYGNLRPQPLVADVKGVKVTYLGTGGLIFERGDDVIVTAPFFSNNPLFDVGAGCIEADTAVIDRNIYAYNKALKKAQAILVGHAHYDHLLDVPHIWAQYMPASTVYGNRSMANLLAGASPVPKIKVIEAELRRDKNTGAFWSTHGGRVKFMPLKSKHAPNIRLPFGGKHGWGLTVAQWGVNRPQDTLPKKARDWRLGQPLAYIIDFRDPADTTKVDFRIYYQDAAHIPDDWHLPQDAYSKDGYGVDLAVVTVASAQYIGRKEYIQAIQTHIKPKHWLLGHWESFFKPYSRNPDSLAHVPMSNPEDFVKEMLKQDVKDKEWVLPAPGAELHY
jgi:L-ascorbate metabolism protein UlaG (beta-lactamase superfamily)